MRILRIIARGQRSTLRLNYSAAKAVLTNRIDAHGSKVQWCAISNTAFVSSELPNSRKSRKRIPKDERQAMVECYVNEYRAKNAGKFPTACDAMNHVGGSFYVIRKIIQELEHKSKLPQSTSGTEISSGPKLNRVKKSGTKVDANSSKVAANAGTEVEDDRLMFVVAESQGSREEITDVSHLSPDKLQDIKRKEVRNDDSDSVAEKSSVKMEVQNVILDVHPHEDNARHSPMEDLTDSGALELRKEPSHDVETEESVKRNDDVDTSRKSSLWENLKSFADSIVNIWKKL
ncbi:uncharacterized protein LOC115734610 [Rhodamnia argentea]|uniref:Uncharacterized protein LOC115734610 n=1 Tax=Rhodamnia argentea TaxID=178133 RepID=A0A8B8NFR7_9MYRT|nr:uncharacterized protein LOC115734610 [Rhodamnia argentea]XP_048138186.1 uncharacterized protein LOC115734610 [Rhodamnia argentea]